MTQFRVGYFVGCLKGSSISRFRKYEMCMCVVFFFVVERGIWLHCEGFAFVRCSSVIFFWCMFVCMYGEIKNLLFI